MGDKSAFVGGMKLKISELGKVITGNTPSKKIKEFWDKDDVGFVKPDIISDEHIVKIKSEDCNEFISNAAISKARIVPKNSIFVTCIGNIGKIGVATENLAFNQQINAIIPNENVNLDYLCYAIFANKTRLQDIANAPIVPLLNKSQFSEFELEFDMDINTQTRIVHELNTVSNIILKYKQELLLLDELVRARFVEMFGDPEDNPFKWDKMPLSNIMLNANNGMARRGSDENGNIVLRLVELQDGYINYSNPNRICLNENEKKRYLLKNNDFLFARVNGNPDNVGRCAVFHDIGEDVYHNDHIIRVHFNEELLNGVFASELINSNFGKRQLKKRIKTSAGQYTVSQDGIGAIVSIVPPLELQNQFASFVEEIDKSRSRIQKSLKASQELFDSLMQEYFG